MNINDSLLLDIPAHLQNQDVILLSEPLRRVRYLGRICISTHHRIDPVEAELWDSPGTLIATVKMLSAAATGTRPDMGENKKVSM